MTDHTTQLSFNEVRELARSNAEQMTEIARILETDNLWQACGDPYDDAAARAEELHGIWNVLEILATTPDAYINREALDALQKSILWNSEMLAEEAVVAFLNEHKIKHPMTDDEILF